MAHRGMRFGIFLAPFHRVGENPTLALARDMELLMPQFQGALDTIEGSNEWCRANRRTIFGPNVPAVRKAYEDAGREVPPDFVWRTAGATIP
jgi:hypothetical protein